MKLLTWRRLHRWVALVVGLQVLAWTTGGVVFAWLDHSAIAGEGLAAPPAVRPFAGDLAIVEPGALGLEAAAVDSLTLKTVDGQQVYRIATARGVELRRARDGAPFRIDETVARALATAAYRGEGRLSALRFHATPTREAREARGATWEAEFDDATGTSLYFSAADGGLVAVRTDAWRLKDFFWMLHTMDYRGRDDFNHPLVVVAAVAALWVAGTGVWLLWRVFRRKGASA